MTITQRYINPTMIIDGIKKSVTFNEWAVLTLAAEELTAFQSAVTRQNAIIDAQILGGSLTITPINASVFVPEINGNIDIPVGIETSSTVDNANDAEWETFWERFKSDPAVTFLAD